MALIVQLNQNVKNVDATNLHSMPCKIIHDGPANVSGFFEPYVEKNESKNPINSIDHTTVLESSFRGHPLQGQLIHIPLGHTGIIMDEIKKPLTDGVKRNLLANKIFKEFHFWNWDYQPTVNDPVKNAVDWLLLSKVVHETEN